MSNVKSKDLIATEAIAKIKSFKKVGDIRVFAKGDKRKTVIDAVDIMASKIKGGKSIWPFGKNKKKEEKAKTTPSR